MSGRPFRKGQGGRPKGSKNRVTAEIAEAMAKSPDKMPRDVLLGLMRDYDKRYQRMLTRLTHAAPDEMIDLVDAKGQPLLARLNNLAEMAAKMAERVAGYCHPKLIAQFDEQGLPPDFDIGRLSNKQLYAMIEGAVEIEEAMQRGEPIN